jgi:hypothetical protein
MDDIMSEPECPPMKNRKIGCIKYHSTINPINIIKYKKWRLKPSVKSGATSLLAELSFPVFTNLRSVTPNPNTTKHKIK